ncbi:MAG: septum formation protein Maf [Candidatus Lambdaproteobacteria bacterium]|nr:septum formation protein Maf [Candidatus Lambdaproteobacteria bacterium]
MHTGMRQTRPYCLASGSPRRRDLLAQLGLAFSIEATDVDETPRAEEPPERLVSRLAEEKARQALVRRPDALILAGDTVVVLGSELLGKPRDESDAAAMLRRLSGRTHRVLTGYALLDGPSGGLRAGVVETRVTFRPLPAPWIAWYSRQPECRDKAGAYAAQGLGGLMLGRIEGSFTNVVGFPVEEIVWQLLEAGWLAL